MNKEFLLALLKNETFTIILFIVAGIILASLIVRLKKYIKKTPSKIDDAIFHFLVNDVFLNVEKDRIDTYIKIFNWKNLNISKLEKALKIFKLCYVRETGIQADASVLNKAKEIWSELALLNDKNKK